MKKVVFQAFAILFFLLPFSSILDAQSGNPNPNPSLTNVTPPSPNAASLGKFGDVPVGYATGVPQINVPIYSYQNADNSLSLSVSLDYHAGGIKIDEVASNVGIGWALNAGGVITRTRRGITDEMPQRGFMNSAGFAQNDPDGNRYTVSQFMQINANLIDGQNDIFNFNFAGRSGKFMYGKNGDFLMLTPSKLKIEKEEGGVSTVTSTSCIKKFTITDEGGKKYVFEEMELTNTGDPMEMTFVSSWYLTKITAPFSTESIMFQYEDEHYGYALCLSQAETVSLDPPNFPSVPISTSIPFSTISGRRIKKITFPDNTEINYEYASALRTDLGPFGDQGNMSRLQKIRISNGSYERGYNLYHSYLLNRLTLTKVAPYSSSGETPGYTFDYHLVNGSGALPDRLNSQQDHWGFYNGNTSGAFFPAQNLSAQYGTQNANLPGGTREVDLERVKCGSLTKITYPTGGYTVFEMEAHQVNNTGLPSQYAGGLRVKTIKNYDGNSSTPVFTKQYDYVKENGTTSSGHLGTYPEYTYSVYYDYHFANAPPVSNYDYRLYIDNGGIPNVIVRVSSPVQTLALTNGSPVNYTRVVEKLTAVAGFNGSTIRYYDSYETQPVFSQISYPYTPPDYEDWGYGELREEWIKDNNDNLLKKTVNEYSTSIDYYYYTPARLANFESITLAPVQYEFNDTYTSFFAWNLVTRPVYFISKLFHPWAGRKDLTKTTVTEYANGLQSVSETNYTYDANYNVKTTVSTNSRNEQIEQVNHYPYDYTASTLAASMINDHNLYGLPVATEVWKTIGTAKYLAGGIVAQYQQQASGIRRTSIETFQNKGLVAMSNIPAFNTASFNRDPSLFKEKVLFNAYNAKGQLVEQQNSNDVKTSYLWGYNNAYPVAEVVGADHATINALVNQSVLDNPSSDAALQAELANLRNNLATVKALVTTYTYRPLTGMTSQTDPNGHTVYYEYDAFGRLSLIRDQNNKILKKICYNYAGQPEDCGLAPACTSCTGEDKKCINGVCETGVKLCIASLLTRGGWRCTYVYYFSDCSYSASFVESTTGPGDIGSDCDIAR